MEIQTENLGAPKGILSTHTGPMRGGGFSRYIAIGLGPRETIISEGPHILISLAIGIDVLFLFFSLFGGFVMYFQLFFVYLENIYVKFTSTLSVLCICRGTFWTFCCTGNKLCFDSAHNNTVQHKV